MIEISRYEQIPREHVNKAIVVVVVANRFHVAVRLFSNRSQMTSECGKNKSGTRGDSRVCH